MRVKDPGSDLSGSNARRLARHCLVVFIAYAAMAEGITLVASFDTPGVAAFWPLSGITVATLLLHRRGDWPWLLATFWLAEFSVDVYNEIPLWVAIGWGAANVVEPLISASILARLGLHPPDLSRRRDLLVFMVIAAFVGPTFGALVGAGAMALAGFDAFIPAAPRWLISSCVGVVVAAPVVLMWKEMLRIGRGQAASVGGVLIAASLALLIGYPSPWYEVIPMLTIPAAILISIKGSTAGAALGIAVIAAIVEGATVMGIGPFTHEGIEEGLIIAQVYLAIVAFVMFLTAALTNDLVDKELLEASERRYRKVSEITSDIAFGGVVADDGGFSLTWVTEGLDRMTSLTMEEINLPGGWLGVFAKEDRSKVLGKLAELVRDGNVAGTARLTPVAGKERWVEYQLMMNEQGEIVGAARDITRERGLEQQVNQASKIESIGRLAGGVAHDFNNLLMIISGSATLARENVHDPQALADIDQIIEATHRGSSLTAQMLEFTRRDQSEATTVDVVALVKGWTAFLRRAIGESVSVELSLSDESIWVFIEPDKLEQCLLNLAINARDSMPDGGLLTIACYLSSDEDPGLKQVVVEVRDTGTGMTEEVKQLAFEPFFTTKSRAEGTGLGLAIVYSSIRSAGGDVEIRSSHGQGTSITMTLPVVEAPKQSLEDLDDQRVAPRALSILLVDDEAQLRFVLRRKLIQEGHQVVAVGSGADAIQLVQADAFDLLLTDVVMPYMSGRDLADRIARVRGPIPTIFMSGYDEQLVGSLGRLERYIQKPFDLYELNRALAELFVAYPAVAQLNADRGLRAL